MRGAAGSGHRPADRGMSALCQKRTLASPAALRLSRDYGISAKVRRLLCLDVGRADHLAPFFGFIHGQLAERGR